MAHLEVEPKPSRPWWIWALVIIVIIALGASVLKQCTSDNDGHPADAKTDTVNASSKNKAVAATVPNWESVDFNTEKTVDKDITATDIYTQSNGTYTIYTLGENILFPPNGNELSSSGIEKLKAIGTVLDRKFKDATIGVFGNADSIGSAQENRKLGMERAEAVKQWLSKNATILDRNLSVRSLGETQPVADNGSAKGRSENRNVAIVIFPKQ